MPTRFPLGKLPNSVLAELLSRVTRSDPQVIVGPGVGLDAAVLDPGNHYLVAATDPITFATDMLGWYAVNVNANDVACMGATPRWFLANLLMPEGKADEGSVGTIFEQIDQACQDLSVSLVGGHTEITFGLDRPILIGTMLGEVEPDRLVTPDGTQVGDTVLLSQAIPIEATAIIARERGAELEHHFEAEFIARSEAMLFDPGISVVTAAKAATGSAEIHGMHDPTEGGLAGGLWELAEAANCRIEVDAARIPILDEGRALCRHFGLDPLASIASGALLLTAPGDGVGPVIEALEAAGIPITTIGSVVEIGSPNVVMIDEEGATQLAKPDRDEITKLFEPPRT